MGELLNFRRAVNGVSVEQRRSDGYINATAMAKAYERGTDERRDVSEWLANTRTQRSLNSLSLKTGIPVFKLFESKAGRYGGTWIHPRLSIRFAIWLSDDFGYLVEEWVAEWFTSGQVPVDSDAEQEYVRWQQRYDIRIELKDVLRPELMNAVVLWAQNNGMSPQTLCSDVHDVMNERIQGAKSQQIRTLGGLPMAVLIRDYLDASPLMNYAAINRLAKNAIQDRGIEPRAAVHEACDYYLGIAYVPKLLPISENVYSQGQRVRKARRKSRFEKGIQLSLLDVG